MQLPSVVRAAVGLAAMAAEEARRLPDRAIEIPMLAVSTALQASLRAQQHYARLTARGDELIHRRPVTDEPPAWATFDEPVGVEELRKAAEHAAAEAGADGAGEAIGDDDGAAATVKPLRAPRKSTARSRGGTASRSSPGSTPPRGSRRAGGGRSRPDATGDSGP